MSAVTNASIQINQNNRLFQIMGANRLTFWEEVGIGYYPSTSAPDFEMAQSIGDKKLAKARVGFVNRHHNETLVDVGIGGGTFIEERGSQTSGYDIDPTAKGWLLGRSLFYDLGVTVSPAISMWDSMTRIPDFVRAIERSMLWAFVSVPIFTGAKQILQSERYRNDTWYFTDRGVRAIFDNLAFDLVETTKGEANSRNYAFKRKEQK